MENKKILVVTGTRAEYGMLRSTMDAIIAHPKLELKLLVTGMHTQETYGATQREIEQDGYPIACIIPIPEGSSMLEALTREIDGVEKYCLRERPDCVLVLGDRGEMFAGATVAAHMNIPIAHIHGGDITGIGVDDGIRNSITKLAHIHFPGTEKSASRITALAEDQRRIFCVGSVAIDTIQHDALLSRENIAKKLAIESARSWLTVVLHPVAFDPIPLDKQIGTALRALDDFPDYEKIVLYPNSDTGSAVFIKELQKLDSPRYHVFPSLQRRTYMSLVKESDSLIGNSSAGIIETGFLGVPTVDVGNRQAGREHAESVLHVEYDESEIVDGIRKAIGLKKKQAGKPFHSPYGSAGAGKKIVEILDRELTRPGLLNKRFKGLIKDNIKV